MNLKSFILYLFLSFVIVQYSFAFNWMECKSFIKNDRSLTGGGWLSSTTSFFTSTGECALIGESDHDAKVFIAHNFDKMLEDFTRGRGEYAYAFAGLYNCDPLSQQLFVVAVKDKYIDLLKLHEKPEVFNFLRAEISKIETAGGSCKTNIHSS